MFVVFTINDCDGAGRSLSLKFIQLREILVPRSAKESAPADDAHVTPTSKKKTAHGAQPKAHALREIKLETPIWCPAGNKIEKWFKSL